MQNQARGKKTKFPSLNKMVNGELIKSDSNQRTQYLNALIRKLSALTKENIMLKLLKKKLSSELYYESVIFKINRAKIQVPSQILVENYIRLETEKIAAIQVHGDTHETIKKTSLSQG